MMRFMRLPLVVSGRVHVRTNKAGQDTIAAQISTALSNTKKHISLVEFKGEQIADSQALPSILFGGLTLMVLNPQAALSVLVADFGASMRLLEPLSLLRYMKIASEEGILIKDGRSLEVLREIDIVIFDKTGTLTHHYPVVGNVFAWGSYIEADIIGVAATLEAKQSHPIAKAILHYAEEQGAHIASVDSLSVEVGFGLQAQLDIGQVHLGSAKFMSMLNIPVEGAVKQVLENCHKVGDSLVFIAVNETIVGAISLSPKIHPEAGKLIESLTDIFGDQIYICSGDHEAPTKYLAGQVGIANYYAEMLPEQKVALVERFQAEGKKVLFIGDGINDSIALKKANLSVSFQGASLAARENTQIILPDDNLELLNRLFDFSKGLERDLSGGLKILLGPSFLVFGGSLFFGTSFLLNLAITNAATGLGVMNALIMPNRRTRAKRLETPATQEKD